MKESIVGKKEKRVCENCRWHQYSIIIDGYACAEGHIIAIEDWRNKYECCDKWEPRRVKVQRL